MLMSCELDAGLHEGGPAEDLFGVAGQCPVPSRVTQPLRRSRSRVARVELQRCEDEAAFHNVGISISCSEFSQTNLLIRFGQSLRFFAAAQAGEQVGLLDAAQAVERIVVAVDFVLAVEGCVEVGQGGRNLAQQRAGVAANRVRVLPSFRVVGEFGQPERLFGGRCDASVAQTAAGRRTGSGCRAMRSASTPPAAAFRY
jgi:hypothetical protein